MIDKSMPSSRISKGFLILWLIRNSTNGILLKSDNISQVFITKT